MANTTLTQVKTALKTVLCLVAPGNGYVKTIAADHFYDYYQPNIQSRSNDALFPKFFLLLESGTSAKEPAGRSFRKLVIMFLIIVKKTQGSDEPAKQIEDFYEDVMKVLLANDTLQGAVQDVTLTEFLTDSGVLHPEGAGLFRIEIEYYR